MLFGDNVSRCAFAHPATRHEIPFARAVPVNRRLHERLLPPIEDRATTDKSIAALLYEQPMRRAVENLRAGQVDPPAADQLQQAGAGLRAGIFHGMRPGPAILDEQAAEDAIDAVDEADPGAQFVRIIVGVVIEDVRADDDVS